MFTAKRLEKQHIVTKNPELTPSEVARQVEVLKRNKLIANNQMLAQEVFECSEMHTFTKGFQIIGEGEEKDEVFFLLFGDVSITTKAKGEIDVLSTPSTVGELAADTPGEPRTASVKVTSESLRARIISGSEFRRIRDSDSEFAALLHSLVGSMNRRKIAQNSEPALLTKAAKPIAIAIIFILSVALINNFLDFDLGQNLSLSGLVALVLTGITTYFDPQHRYGRMFTAVLFSTLLYILHFGASLALWVDGRSTPVPFLWNFSAESEQSPLFAILNLLALIFLCVVCERADRKRNGFDS